MEAALKIRTSVPHEQIRGLMDWAIGLYLKGAAYANAEALRGLHDFREEQKSGG